MYKKQSSTIVKTSSERIAQVCRDFEIDLEMNSWHLHNNHICVFWYRERIAQLTQIKNIQKTYILYNNHLNENLHQVRAVGTNSRHKILKIKTRIDSLLKNI